MRDGMTQVSQSTKLVKNPPICQGTIDCAILESGIGGSRGGNGRKWESERGREKGVAFVCKMI